MDIDTVRLSPNRDSIEKPIQRKEIIPKHKQRNTKQTRFVPEGDSDREDYEDEKNDTGEPVNEIETFQITELKNARNDVESDQEEGEFEEVEEQVEETEESGSENDQPSKEDAKDGDYVDESDQSEDSDGGSKHHSRKPAGPGIKDLMYKARCLARVQVVRTNMVKSEKKKFDEEVTLELMNRVVANPKIKDRPKVAKLAVENQLVQKFIQCLDSPHRLRILAEVEDLAPEILDDMIDAKEEEQIRKKEIASVSSVALSTGVHIRLNGEPARHQTAEERYRRAALITFAEPYILDKDDHEAQVEALVKHKTIRRPVYTAHQSLLWEIVEAALAAKTIENLPDNERAAAEKELKTEMKRETKEAKMEVDQEQLTHARQFALVRVASSYGERMDAFDRGTTSDTILVKYERSDEKRKRKIESDLKKDVLEMLEADERIEALQEIEERAMATVRGDAFRRASACFFKQLAPTRGKEASTQHDESSYLRGHDVGSDDEETFLPPKHSMITSLAASTGQLIGQKRKRQAPNVHRPRPPKVRIGKLSRRRKPENRKKAELVERGSSSEPDVDSEREEEMISAHELEIAALRQENESLRESLARNIDIWEETEV